MSGLQGVTVAVTGSSGLIGRRVVAQLEMAGARVVALHRDAGETDRWPALCADVDAVVHLAAPASGVTDTTAEAALQVTSRLFDALPDRPVHIVFAGSMSLYKPLPSSAALDENSELWRGDDLDAQDGYTRMKSAQEALVRRLCLERGMSLSVIRPTNVWDEQHWIQACVGPKVGPFWFIVAPRRSLRLIHVDNCASALISALRGRTDGVRVMNVDDDANVSAWRYATRIVEWRKRGYLPVPVAGWLFEGFASFGAFCLRALRPRRRPPGLLLRDRRDSRFGGYRVDTALARACMHWSPDLRPYGARQGTT